MKNIKEKLLKADNIRTCACILAMCGMFYYSIEYMSAGTTYDQQVCFRPFCIAFGIMILSLLPIRSFLNWVTPFAAVGAFLTSKFLYNRHIIIDYCDYKFPEIIRLGKLVAIVWTIVFVAVLFDLIKYKALKNYKTINRFSLIGIISLIIMFGLIFVFRHKYYYVYFLIVSSIALFNALADDKRRIIFSESLEITGVIALIYVMILSILFRPFCMEQRYLSYFANSNSGGFFFGIAIPLTYMRIYKWWNKEKNMLRTGVLSVYFFIFGIGFSMTLYNYARTTILGILFSSIVLFIIHLKNENRKDVIKRMAYLVISVVALFYVTFLLIRWVPAYVNRPIYRGWEEGFPNMVHAGDPVDSEKYTSFTQYLRIVFGKWGILIDFGDEYEDGKEGAIVVDGRDVTNGRVYIWNKYISLLSITGNEQAHLYDDEGEIIYHAHNTYLHMSHLHGIIAGILYFMLNLYVCALATCRSFFGKKKDDVGLLATAVLCMAVVAQLTETMVHPAYCITFVIYAGILLVCTEHKNTESEV